MSGIDGETLRFSGLCLDSMFQRGIFFILVCLEVIVGWNGDEAEQLDVPLMGGREKRCAALLSLRLEREHQARLLGEEMSPDWAQRGCEFTAQDRCSLANHPTHTHTHPPHPNGRERGACITNAAMRASPPPREGFTPG